MIEFRRNSLPFRVNFLLAFAVGTCLGLTGCEWPKNENKPTPSFAPANTSALRQVKSLGVLRAGYLGYPPFTIKGEKPGEVTGLAVDMLNRIVNIWDRGIKIEWVETSADRMKPDLLAGRFSVEVDAIFQTIGRASEVGFTRPYFYSGYGVAVVGLTDERFKMIEDFNREDITIVVSQGASSADYVKRVFPRAKTRVLPSTSLEQPALEVLLGKADAAFADVPTLTRFLAAHPGKVKTLFFDNPPVIAAAGFMVPPGDYEWTSFLSIGIDVLENTGELEALMHKYGLPYYRTVRERVLPPPTSR